MPIKSYCAEGDGTSDYIALPFTFVDGENSIEFWVDGEYEYGKNIIGGSSSGERSYFGFYGDKIGAGLGDSAWNLLPTSDFVDNVPTKIKFLFNNITKSASIYINDVLENSITFSGPIGMTNNILLFKDPHYSENSNVKLWGLKLNDSEYPLQGSCYDISGNGNHGTNHGCDLIAVQDEFHYNLRKGFGEGVEELTDGDMEAVGTSAWDTNDSVLSKVPSTLGGGTQALRITSVSATFWAVQHLLIGKIYKVSGYARSDGTARPKSMFIHGATWVGTLSGDWQYFEIISIQLDSTSFYLGSADATGWVEFDNVSVREVAVPRLANNSGFPAAVAEEHLAGTWSNMSENYFRFKDTLTSDIMDKSKVDIWSADVRSSVYYDSSNPRDWHSSELIQEYLDDNINPTYKNRVFVADNNTTFVKDGSDWVMDGADYVVEFGDGATQGKQILIYNVEQTGKDLEKIIKFLSKEY